MAGNANKFKDIISYYDGTRFDYWLGWDRSRYQALHFGYYDEKATKHKDALRNMNRKLAEAAKIKPTDHVLDAGCGHGGSSFWLANHYGTQVTGISPVPNQILKCHKISKELKLEGKTDFKVADYCNTPFEDQEFDVVWACESICYAEKKSDFYKEAFRLLKPGGRLVIAGTFRTHRPDSPEAEKLMQEFMFGWAIKDMDTKDEHQANAANNGFVNVRIQDVTKNVLVSVNNIYNQSKKWFWASKLLLNTPLRSKVQHANQITSFRLKESLEKDLWFYGIISAEKPG